MALSIEIKWTVGPVAIVIFILDFLKIHDAAILQCVVHSHGVIKGDDNHMSLRHEKIADARNATPG
jgi:hypothetical protein